MELNDIASRIIGQRWRLILVFVVLNLGVAALLHVGDSKTYTASARLVLDIPDPESRAESVAIADTAKAIATSPAQVRAALRTARVAGRDPLAVAQDHVAVRGLGSSGVVQLAVSDRDPEAAAAVANALAAAVIRTRLNVTQGEVQRVLGDLDVQTKDLTRTISKLDVRIESLNLQVARESNPRRASAIRARRDESASTRALLVQQRASLESQRDSLLSAYALRPKPSIISRAAVPAHADPSRWLPDMVLGGLLGLILGVGCAGVIEAFRPRLIGGDAVAREFDTPLLGAVRSDSRGNAPLVDQASVAARIRLAAEAAGTRNVGLLGVEPHVDVARLAETLQAASAGDERGVSIRPFALDDLSLNNGSRAGLVLVSPTTLEMNDVAQTKHLLRVAAFPLLGVIAYTGSRRGGRVLTQLGAAIT